MTHTCARTQIRRSRHDIPEREAVVPTGPSNEEIARLAYGYWEARGRQNGSAEDDWYRAERELTQRKSGTHSW
jgi:hypothetical protein